MRSIHAHDFRTSRCPARSRRRRMVKYYGWDTEFELLLASAIAGTVLFAIVWPAKADGYRNGAGGAALPDVTRK